MEAIRRTCQRAPEDTMERSLWSALCCASLLLAGVRATYHLGTGDPQLIAAQSYAQTRNNGRPPIRTLNPASESLWKCVQMISLSLLDTFNLSVGSITFYVWKFPKYDSKFALALLVYTRKSPHDPCRFNFRPFGCKEVQTKL